MNKFTQEFHIPCYNTDMSWRLKPAAFMDLAQEAANQHATILGFGYDDLITSKTAWVLSRMMVPSAGTVLMAPVRISRARHGACTET